MREEKFVAFAAVEGGAAGWSWLFTDLCACNGERYGVHLFGSLPSETSGDESRIPEAVVRDAYRRFLDAGDDSDWWAFEVAVRADTTSLDPQERVQAQVRAYFEQDPLTNPPEPLSAEMRAHLLDLYFTHCYR